MPSKCGFMGSRSPSPACPTKNLSDQEKDRPEGRSEESPAVMMMMPAMMVVPVMVNARHDDQMRPNVTVVVSARVVMPMSAVMTVLDLYGIRTDFGF